MADFIMVPVPPDRVQEVYDLLARKPTPQIRVESALSTGWTDEELRHIYSRAKGAIKTMLRTLAERPGERIYSSELYKNMGYTREQFSGTIGAFGKLVKNTYKKSTKPYKEGWDDAKASMYYEMTPHNASVMRSAFESD